MKKPENPQAFPHLWSCIKDEVIEDGMTLRDYFAAKAMQSVILFVNEAPEYFKGKKQTANEIVSEWAYQTADAMLKERANYE